MAACGCRTEPSFQVPRCRGCFSFSDAGDQTQERCSAQPGLSPSTLFSLERSPEWSENSA